MDIDYTVAALMFPAIPLMMTMYSNRFHTLSGLIRKLHDQLTFDKRTPPEWENQLHVLNSDAVAPMRAICTEWFSPNNIGPIKVALPSSSSIFVEIDAE